MARRSPRGRTRASAPPSFPRRNPMTLHVPELHLFEENGITYAIDPTAPNWIAVEERGALLLAALRESPMSLDDLVARYAALHQLEAGKAWLHAHDFVTALGRASMVNDAPFVRDAYRGRAEYIKPEG